MNKVILGLILAVCVLGMALVMLNERLGRENDSSPRMQAANEQMQPETPRGSPSYTAPAQTDILPADKEESAPPLRNPSLEAAMRMERDMAEEALAPPAPAQPVPEAQVAEPPASEVAPPPAAPEPEPAAQPKPEARPEPKPAPKPAPAPRPQAEAPKKETEKPAAAKSGNVINRFVIYSREKGATVRIGGNGAIAYKSMTLENPDRVVLDLDGHWQFPPNPGVPKNDLVNNVRIGQMGDKTRVVIDLKEKPRSTRVIPAKKGDSLDVRVDK